MNGYGLEGWHDFFVAEVGAAAALTGPRFVALSTNLTRILALPGRPAWPRRRSGRHSLRRAARRNAGVLMVETLR